MDKQICFLLASNWESIHQNNWFDCISLGESTIHASWWLFHVSDTNIFKGCDWPGSQNPLGASPSSASEAVGARQPEKKQLWSM